MSYDASVAQADKILDLGIAAQPSSGAALMNGGSIFRYCSSHAGTDLGGVTGFFEGCGAQVLHSSGPPPYESITRSTNNIGMRPGDALLNVESSAGASPGKVTWHAVVASTYGTDGYDVTVST